MDNNQPGDVVKGAKIIVDVLTKMGVAEGKDVPIRAALESGSSVIICGKCEEMTRLLGKWNGVTDKTDHEWNVRRK